MRSDTDKVFKALADPTRRYLLDRLHEHNGQTLTELCERVEMARQSATQHLDLLEGANLVSTVRRGREKLHYLNPVPLHEIQERWIDKFERPRLRALSALKRRAEEAMNDKPTFVYTIYIESTPEAVWHALTDAELTAEYWGHSNVSDWKVGSQLGAPAHGRDAHRRRRRHGRGELAAEAVGDDLGRARRGAGRRPVARVVRHRALRRDRPPHRDPREPPQRSRSRRGSDLDGQP